MDRVSTSATWPAALTVARGVAAAPESPNKPSADRDRLLFSNGLGGFALDGRRYVLTLEGHERPPAPWSNVLANPDFGCLVTEAGGGYTWAGNAQMNRLTPWSNDPVTDTPGEALYLRDEETGEFWTPTPAPRGGSTTTVVRHGQGYTRFNQRSHGLDQDLVVFVSRRRSCEVDASQSHEHRRPHPTVVRNVLCRVGPRHRARSGLDARRVHARSGEWGAVRAKCLGRGLCRSDLLRRRRTAPAVLHRRPDRVPGTEWHGGIAQRPCGVRGSATALANFATPVPL